MTGDTVAATGVGRQKANKAAWAILAAMGFGALIAQMFSTVIGPALPTIKEDLALGLSAQTWTITAYSLAFGAALVAGGRMGDLVGEVRMIVIGFLIFGAGLLMSAIAVGGPLLISGRAIQGIGIGISAPATLSIVVNSFPLAQRGLAVGVGFRTRIRASARTTVRRLDDGDRQLALGVLGRPAAHRAGHLRHPRRDPGL
jgi:MFS family permease